MTATDELRRLLDERGVEHMDFNMPERSLTLFAGDEHDGAYTENSVDTILTVYGASPEQAIAATLGSCNCSNSERTSDSDATAERRGDAVEVVRCRDCEHGHITINGKSCKWCDLIATHDIDGNEPNNGYDPEPYFDADFFCAWGERRDA